MIDVYELTVPLTGMLVERKVEQSLKAAVSGAGGAWEGLRNRAIEGGVNVLRYRISGSEEVAVALRASQDIPACQVARLVAIAA